MRYPIVSYGLGVGLGLCPCLALGQTPFPINNLTDTTVYSDTVTFSVPVQAGYAYGLWLNGLPVPAGTNLTVNRPDYYELHAWRTNLAAPFEVTNRLVRFIVAASERGSTEWGLPPQTPWPLIPSCSNEFVGARLRLMVPREFPTGHEIPVVAWVVNEQGHAVRANGWLAAQGHPAIQIKRGVGSGFLAATHPAGPLVYAPSLPGLSTNVTIQLQASPSWTPVGGLLAGAVAWPENARIHVTNHLLIGAGATLTIGAGSLVRLNAGVNITNDGSIIIAGTVDRPVVFMPNQRSQPWGGFFVRSSAAVVDATGAIFTGSGANPTGGAGHRREQCLFMCTNSPRVTLTDCAAIALAGQLGHAYNGGRFTFTRFLLQGCTTGGEYTGAQFTVTDSAFIDCYVAEPFDRFNDGDEDALYLVDAPLGPHTFTNTLFGWTKDDGVDSGGSGYGPLRYQTCWFEGIYHEGNSLSGYKDTRAWDTVYLDCGQGIEDGYNAPTGRVERCLFAACKVGVRHGDNYENIGAYDGNITVTNCLFLQNHHDVFGYNWRKTNGVVAGWTNAVGQMFVQSNLLFVPDTNFPHNQLWNPATDAGRLAAFGAVGHVGLGLAVWPGRTSLADFADGVPVGLSMFCTNEVTVDYTVEASDGQRLGGTLRFAPGETRQFIPPPPSFTGVLRVALSNPRHADLTGQAELWLQNLPPVVFTNVVLVASNSLWRYLDDGSDQGTAWRAPDFDDRGWSNGLAQLGFGDSPRDEATLIRRVGPAGTTNITFYFRQAFTVADPTLFSTLRLWLLRDDAGVVYLNGTELFRSPNLPAAPTPILYNTFATATGENTVDQATVPATALVAGRNVIAVEIHQQSLTSSDVSFDFQLQGVVTPRPRLQWWRRERELVLYWADPAYSLWEAPDLAGPWQQKAGSSPAAVPLEGTRFYRLRR